MKSENVNETIEPRITKLDIWKFIINYGIVLTVLISYGFFVKYLLTCIETDEPYWSRMILLFSSIEAIAFGALGYVFGKEITKKVAKTAEEGQKNAKEEAKEAKEKQKETEEKTNRIKDKLTALREAVIAEQQTLNPNLRLTQIRKDGTNKNIARTPKSRAHKLALLYDDVNILGLSVDFKYTITAEDFKYIQIDGVKKTSKSGRFSSVPAYGRKVRVEVIRGSMKPWEFKATAITDQDGESMEMVSSPLKSSSNSDSFYIKY